MIQNKKMIRMSCIVLAIILFLFINIKWVKGGTYDFYNITYSCKDNICIEGQTAMWTATIYNKGNGNQEYIGVELLNSLNNSLIAEFKIPLFPLRSDRGDVILIRPGEKASVNLTGKLPKANYQDNLFFYPCFTTTITDTYLIAKFGEYESRFCYEQNVSMPVIQCISDKNCNSKEICKSNSCIKLKCKECQYIKNHACLDYECCNSEECGLNEICKSNVCQKLNCSQNEYIENRTCKILNCGFDEHIINKTCKKLNCSYNQQVFNHTCRDLNCKEEEFIENHECKPLNCKENEYVENHTCGELKCLYNETFFDHTCKPLGCYFFQDIKNHQCTNNKSFIFKSILEVIAIIAIIIFLILDIIKYEIQRKKSGKTEKETKDKKVYKLSK